MLSNKSQRLLCSQDVEQMTVQSSCQVLTAMFVYQTSKSQNTESGIEKCCHCNEFYRFNPAVTLKLLWSFWCNCNPVVNLWLFSWTFWWSVCTIGLILDAETLFCWQFNNGLIKRSKNLKARADYFMSTILRELHGFWERPGLRTLPRAAQTNAVILKMCCSVRSHSLRRVLFWVCPSVPRCLRASPS